jgi:hypothetical protein
MHRLLGALSVVVIAGCECGLPTTVFTEVARHPDAALMSVGGTGPTDVWLVGAQPAPNTAPIVLHGDGTSWTPVETGVAHDLWWVHAFSGGPTYLVGGGGSFLRVDDGVATRLPAPGFAGLTAFGVWGAAADDVWAVGGHAGRAGFIWRSDGVTVRTEPVPLEVPRSSDGELGALLKVWGRGENDVWIVGGVGTVLHWDGEGLRVIPTNTTETLFTVHGDADEVVIVGGSSSGILLRGGVEGLLVDTPPGAPLLQGVVKDARGNVWVAGADGFAAGQPPNGEWQLVTLGFADDERPSSIHALWHDGAGGLYAVGGNVLTPALDDGVAVSTEVWSPYLPTVVEPPPPTCPDSAVDPTPDGSIARRWREQLLNAIRRDVPNPPVHARNLLHTSMAIWDAWAAYDPAIHGVFTDVDAGAADIEAARETAISYAAYRVLRHRYEKSQGAGVSRACFDDFMAVLGLDPEDTHETGGDPTAVGNLIGRTIIETALADGSNEAEGYKDTTGWVPTNPVMVVDRPGTNVTNPNVWQQLNLALAETQNGIILDETVQPYIGPHWRQVTPFAMSRDPDSGLYSVPGDFPSVDDDRLIDEVVEVIVKTSHLDIDDGVEIDISPGAIGDNTLGHNDGDGHEANPFTGQPYAPNVVKRGDFTRVVAEMWADGPKSETPPGHWLKIVHEISDDMAALGLPFIPYGEGEPVDRLAWDVAIGLAVTGATHDAAIAAWELKRVSQGPRPISLVRYFAGKGQRSDPTLPSYNPEGLPLVAGVIELITESSSLPGERHFHLRHFQGELAIRSWPGEPGDRANDHTSFVWMRALDWIPYQRRTFVTPAFPGFVSGHSTFSRAAAEALAAFTGSPFFPGGLKEFVAPKDNYLIFENGPSDDVKLQWATYFDAADQSGQSRILGGIHIFSDDTIGRRTGSVVGQGAVAKAKALWDGDVP